MSRELRPDFFGSTSSSNIEDLSVANVAPTKSASIAEVDAADLQIISAQLDGLKQHIKKLNQKSQKHNAILDELVSSNTLKFDRFKQAFHRVEDFVKNNINEVQGKIGQINSKLVASNYNDSKLEQIIERHNQTVHSFENKLNQLQKVINQQEMQLMNYKAALEEARIQFSHFKKL